MLTGFEDQMIELIHANSLGAVCSISRQGPNMTDIAQITKHQNIIASIFDTNPVIPVRFGCVLETREKVIEFLEKQQDQYSKILNTIENCEEFGIRVILNQDGTKEIKKTRSRQGEQKTIKSSSTSGTSYLLQRKTELDSEQQRDDEIKELSSTLNTMFKGCIQTMKMDRSFRQVNLKFDQGKKSDPGHDKHSALVSFYFLVPKKRRDEFRSLFQKIVHKVQHKMMLSGPWPPYNFVDSTDESRGDRLSDLVSSIKY